MEQSLTKAVDTLATQLKEKDELLHSLQAQLSAKESYISQLHQVIVATGGSVPATASTAAAAAATKGLSKNQLKKQKKQQKQAQPAASAPVTPLKEQPAPAPEAVPAATPTTPESAKNKRKRDATKGTHLSIFPDFLIADFYK
jgi:septal ring factor EnvC (AmiA/AmiB activator)